MNCSRQLMNLCFCCCCSVLFCTLENARMEFHSLRYRPTFLMGLEPLNLFLPSMNKTESLISESQCYLIIPTLGWEQSFKPHLFQPEWQAFEREGEVNYGARPQALSPSRAQIPPSPSPFNACHAGYTYSSQLFCSLYFAILRKQKIKTWYLKRE